MTERHNADLANGLGNLASRVLAMLGSYFDGAVPEPVTPGAESDLPDGDRRRRSRGTTRTCSRCSSQPALVAVWDIVARANRYLVEKEPWKLAKDDANRDELASVLYAAAETLRILAIAIQPIMPSAAARAVGAARDRARRSPSSRLPADGVWGRPPRGYPHHQG